jgi:hypothetical protein
MSSVDVTSHFWVASSPSLSSTLFVVPGDLEVSDGRSLTVLELYDVDGVKVNSVEVEFPSSEVGVVELEPFATGLKVQGGIAHGHLAVTSLSGSRHVVRQSMKEQTSIFSDPTVIRSRESCFAPLTLSARREHIVALVNASVEEAELTVRLFYGSRSPEWSVVVTGNGSKLISLEEDLLYTADDRVWEKSQLQSYIRVTSKGSAQIACQVLERVCGDSPDQDLYRTVTTW